MIDLALALLPSLALIVLAAWCRLTALHRRNRRGILL